MFNKCRLATTCVTNKTYKLPFANGYIHIFEGGSFKGCTFAIGVGKIFYFQYSFWRFPVAFHFFHWKVAIIAIFVRQIYKFIYGKYILWEISTHFIKVIHQLCNLWNI